MSVLTESSVQRKSAFKVNREKRIKREQAKNLAGSDTNRLKSEIPEISYSARARETAIDSPRFISRYKLESALYRLSGMVAAVFILVLLDSFFALLPDSASATLAIASLLAALLMSAVRIPADKFVTLGKIRAGATEFLSRELKFAAVFLFAVFFLDLNVNPILFVGLLLINFGVQTALFLLWRKYNNATANPQNKRPPSSSETNVIIIGASARGKYAADLFLDHHELDNRVLGFIDPHKKRVLWRYRDIPLLGHLDMLDKIILQNHVDYVVLALEPKDIRYSRTILSTLEKMGVDICFLPQIHDRIADNCRPCSVNGQPMLLYRSKGRNGLGLFLKDVVDRLGALVGLIISAPILLISAIVIKIDSRGPVMFKQVRSGKNGKTFEMYKLRTMTVHADEQKEKLSYLNEMTGPVFKIKKDPRITRVGRFLRKFSIDEFPQFINILKGEMSLVGPRPPLPGEVVQYKPWQRRRLSVKPGATCLWQINGRNGIDFENWTELDLQYIDTWSLKEDVRILLKTIPAVLKTNGAS